MNLYIRFFDDECVVTSIEEALEFIRTFQGFKVTPDFEDDFRQYAEGDVMYPKRYKVRSRIYFIVIKTMAATLEEFKANGKHNAGEGSGEPATILVKPKDIIEQRLNEVTPGWYEGFINFKRVVFNPETGKCDYVDTSFSAITKAWSPMDCYNRLVDYARSRDDVDERSQFPSPRGKNFKYEYIGLKPLSAVSI
ncbi:MAG: hypothetical protein IJ209_09480 [Bacteroidaceae bacterium]|nr:hypothetical protein [Bacteroidaceae bacterium]